MYTHESLIPKALTKERKREKCW